MTRWFLILLALAGPVMAQTLDAPGSKAGIPFSPTQQWGYSTVQHGPSEGHTHGTGYYGYGYRGGNYYYNGGGYYGDYSSPAYPGSYNNPYGSGPSSYSNAGFSGAGSRSSGRAWPSAREESRLHEIRR